MAAKLASDPLEARTYAFDIISFIYDADKKRIQPGMDSYTTEMQIALNASGYPVGRVDGRPGPGTLQAIERFRLDFPVAPDNIAYLRGYVEGTVPLNVENGIIRVDTDKLNPTMAAQYELLKQEDKIGDIDPATQQRIREIVGENNIIDISGRAARNFVTNLKEVGNNLIMSGVTPEVEATLKARGYNVVNAREYGLNDLSFNQGGVHCMTNELPVQKTMQPGLM